MAVRDRESTVARQRLPCPWRACRESCRFLLATAIGRSNVYFQCGKWIPTWVTARTKPTSLRAQESDTPISAPAA